VKIQLGATDANRVIIIQTGDYIELHLTENGTTSYRWCLESSSGITQIFDTFQPPVDKWRLGASGVRVITLLAKEAGFATIKTTLQSPYDNKVSEVLHFFFDSKS
jgi:predicted secreted protein